MGDVISFSDAREGSDRLAKREQQYYDMIRESGKKHGLHISEESAKDIARRMVEAWDAYLGGFAFETNTPTPSYMRPEDVEALRRSIEGISEEFRERVVEHGSLLLGHFFAAEVSREICLQFAGSR